MANEILTNTVSLTFSWVESTGATKNHCRISRYYDFSVIDHESNTLTTGDYTVTLTTGNYKYYWQHCSYVGTAWLPWNEVQSFEKVSSGAQFTITDGKWMMFEASERAARSLIFTSAPNYTYTESQLYRTTDRNLAGNILSEFWTTKGKIVLSFGENNTVSKIEKDQIMRYYGMNNKDVYLACAPYNGQNYYRKLWKIFFVAEPEVQSLPGNEERYIIELELEER